MRSTQQNRPPRLIKVFADSTSRKFANWMMCGSFAVFVVIYIIALFAIPPAFQYFDSNDKCIFTGPSSPVISSTCHALDFRHSKVWQIEVSNVNATNVFIGIDGYSARSLDDVSSGEITRLLHGALLPNRSNSIG